MLWSRCDKAVHWQQL